MTRADSDQGQSIYRLRWVGYGLLLLALFDTIEVLTPPQFTNPAWEFQTIGALVERVPVPLLGLVLVFFGESFNRSRLEEIFLKILSWFCLLLAALFLLLVPLGIVNTMRINTANNQQITAQAQQQLTQLKDVEEAISKGSNEDIKNLANQLNNLGIAADANNPQQFKTQILEKIPTARQQVQKQAQTAMSGQRTALLKNSVKWNLGALVAAVLLFGVWRGTGWARR